MEALHARYSWTSHWTYGGADFPALLLDAVAVDLQNKNHAIFLSTGTRLLSVNEFIHTSHLSLTNICMRKSGKSVLAAPKAAALLIIMIIIINIMFQEAC